MFYFFVSSSYVISRLVYENYVGEKSLDGHLKQEAELS